ncbi:MAG: exodeoxyribonuclease VII small subunit [Acetatifactor sp.]|nr:exodeoxyribonuclease VII small subunit [Acetatifactor sp.]
MTEKKERDQAPSIEQNFSKLEETIQQLESEEISLEEAFACYSEGMRLIKNCNAQIDRVEKQVLKLTEEGALEPLDAEL